eukprot:GHVN01020039.1.p1 GENE.GHVN01020039.1~~GHVN01020039.1.p1  ORF type:complete len:374 (-),score=17.07 GHVN01020039.1:199-1320(-)
MTVPEQVSRPHQVILGVALYCGVSLSIVLLNRYLFDTVFPFPVFISWFQQVEAFFLCQLLAAIGHFIPTLSFFPLAHIDWRVLWGVLPTCIALVGMTSFANICLKYVLVSTYQTARALTLVFNLALSRLMLGTSTSPKAWLSCMVMVCAFIVGSIDSSTLNFVGVMTGAASSLFQAYFSVSIKRSLQFVGHSTAMLMLYTQFSSIFLYLPVIFIAGEGEVAKYIMNGTFFRCLMPMITSGLLVVAITFATYYCVKVTSPVTFSVVGYAKACIQSFLGILLLGEVVTPQSLTGIVLTLIGSYAYTRVKMKESSTASEPEPQKAMELSSSSPTPASKYGKDTFRLPPLKISPEDEGDDFRLQNGDITFASWRGIS